MENNNSWILKHIGLPFLTKGRSARGLDCWGLLCHIYEVERGILLPSYQDHYDSVTDALSITRVFSQEKKDWVKVDVAQPLDAIMFNIHGRPVHVGIAAYDDYFIHSPQDDFTRLERFTDRIWKNRIEGFYRHV